MSKYLILSLAAGGSIIFLWLANWFWVPHTGTEAQGQFGDQFGAVNALFSGLAFAGVIITLIMQMDEMKRQGKDAQMQRFDSHFFNLLDYFRQSLGSIIHLQFNGAEVLKYASDVLNRKLTEELRNATLPEKISAFQSITKPELTAFLNSSYMANLVNVVDFVGRSTIDEAAKTLYINIINTQMSVTEKKIVFWYLMKNENWEHKELLKKHIHSDFVRDDVVRVFIAALEQQDVIQT